MADPDVLEAIEAGDMNVLLRIVDAYAGERRWDDLLEIGSWNKAKELGKLRVEGKDYEVQDGDVLEIRHSS